jgi:uncharacterized membrane protein
MFFKKDSFLSTEQKARIVNAIREAELQTSGEIRIHIEASCPAKEPVSRAIEVFNKQKMYDTKDKNGILIYVAHGDRKFAIYGDKGIHAQVAENYWSDTLAVLSDYFKKEQYEEGLSAVVLQIGEKLKQLFPYSANDKNELPNEISEG